MKYPKMTHEEHRELAQLISEARELLWRAQRKVEFKFGKSHRANKSLWKLLQVHMESVRSPLDDEYHKVTSEAQFQEYGHVYYP